LIETVSMFDAEIDSLWISLNPGNSCSMKTPLLKPVTSRFEEARKED
jgi:hypothetical protein